MALGVATLALLLVAQCSALGLFESGQEYQYSYLAYTSTGVKEPAPFGSSFGIKGNLLVQYTGQNAVVKLSDIGVAVHNGPEHLINSVAFIKKPELAILEKPFKLSYNNGKITGLEADASDAEWSINIKKGLATALQVDASTDIGRGENTFLRTVEETVTGTCNTTYSFGAADPKGRYSLIKQRTLSECTNVPRIGLNLYGATNCAGKLQDEILATTQAYYQFSRTSTSLKAHIISSLGYQVLQWHPPSGAPLFNVANQTMYLKSSGPIAKPIAATGLTKRYTNLRYTLKRPIPTPDQVDLTREEDFFHPEEPHPQPVLRTKVVEALESIQNLFKASPLDEASLTDPNIMGAIQLVGSLSLDSLREVYETVEGSEETKNVFIQVLPYSGSNPAALFIKELILDGKVSQREGRRLVAFIPYFIRLPTEKLLEEYEILLKEHPNLNSREMRSAVALAFGHLIGATCSNPLRPPCRPDIVNKYSRIAFEAFKGAKTHSEQMVTLLALGNSRLMGAIEKLIPLSKPGAVSHIIRPHVIYNLAPLAKVDRNRFLAVVMPVILNQTESTEVRIAAIATLFNVQPTFLELQQITAGILWERNAEFSNFVITTFKNYAEAKSPCIAPWSKQLQLLLRRIGHIKTSHFRSNNRIFDYMDSKYNFGGSLQLATVYGEESRAPVVIYGRANYRVSEWGYTPIEIMIRLEGVEDAYVKMFRRLDTKDFKLDTLKDLLQKTLKIAPRQQNPMKAELIIRSQRYNLMYRQITMEEIGQLIAGKGLAEALARGIRLAGDMVTLGGRHISWRANDIGIPVGVGLTNPGLLRTSLSYGAVNEPGQQGIFRSITGELDALHQVGTYLVAYNPLGASQGIVKVRGSRIHLPLNAQVGFTPAENSAKLKLITPTSEEPLSALFTSKTVAFMWGKDIKRAVSYMKESCAQCEPNVLVTQGEAARKGRVFRDNENEILGMQSDVEVYNCETYTGKAALSRVIYESFKPSEINSHGSIPGYLVMGFMQLRNYFYYYPPTGTCSMKAVVHRTSENPAEAVEITLKRDQNAPAGKAASKTKSYQNVKGQAVLTGPIERRWNFEVNIESEPFNVRSAVAVKIARLPTPELKLTARALCASVKTTWAPLPEDIFETPSAVEPSVSRDVTFAWGEAPANDCPKPFAKGVSSISVKVSGNITDAQREAASQRDRYPFDRCDADRNADGRSGVVHPMTQACYEAVMEYGTPRHYTYDINYENLSDRGMKALHRIKTTLTAALLPYWDMHAPHGHSAKKGPNSGHIELKLEFNDRDTDVHLHTDVLHSHFENIEFLDPLRDVVLRNARLQMGQIAYIRSGLLGICNVAPQATVTFDNVTLAYGGLPTCYTLASADCSAEPRYAVFVKKSNKKLPLAAKIYVGGHSVELIPTDSGVDIKVNDKKIPDVSKQPYKLASTDGIIEFLNIVKVGPRYFVRSPALKLVFRYTGDDITNMIPATHRSQHCGICGDFNGQSHAELVGPTGCTMKDANDLVKSYILKKDCKEPVTLPACSTEITPLEARFRSSIVDFLDQFKFSN